MDESAVLAFLLAGDDAILAVLREQAEVASIAHRECTGAGFFLHFDVPPTAARLTSVRSLRIGDAGCAVNGNDCGLLLFVNEGVLDFLECHVWGDANLQEPLRLQDPYYFADGDKTGTRNLEALRASWGAA
jgi:hypothetical protein